MCHRCLRRKRCRHDQSQRCDGRRRKHGGVTRVCWTQPNSVRVGDLCDLIGVTLVWFVKKSSYCTCDLCSVLTAGDAWTVRPQRCRRRPPCHDFGLVVCGTRRLLHARRRDEIVRSPEDTTLYGPLCCRPFRSLGPRASRHRHASQSALVCEASHCRPSAHEAHACGEVAEPVDRQGAR